jgi:hypothetical protein
MKKITVVLVVIVLAAAVTFAAIQYQRASADQAEVVHNPNEPGGKYLRDLRAAIENADDITITEHSDKSYYITPDRGLEGYKEQVYAVVKISQSEKRGLIEMVNALDTTTQNAFPACIFDPHHRLAFHSKGKLASTMEVCFECGQIEWDGSTQTPPWAIYRGMKAFVAGIGLHPKADWWNKYESSVAATQGKP